MLRSSDDVISKTLTAHGSGFSSATSYVKYEAHFRMMVVDVDAAMAENHKPFQRLGSGVCMGLNNAVAFLVRFLELICA